jgi:hypothetical protein
LFDNTSFVSSGNTRPANVERHYVNYPPPWRYPKEVALPDVPPTGSTLDLYSKEVRLLFSLPDAKLVVASLAASLAAPVASRVADLRTQYRKLHMCAHIRLGDWDIYNGTRGDWEKKTWRHVSKPELLMERLLAGMQAFAVRRQASDVSVFLASDSPLPDRWFSQRASLLDWHMVHSKSDLHVIHSKRSIRPETAMRSAASDMFALGECDALFIPTYSAFTVTPIILAQQHNLPVYFYSDGNRTGGLDMHWAPFVAQQLG